MSRAALRRAALLCPVLAVLLASVASAGPSIVEVDNLILRADGGFRPRQLPRKSFAPIEFQGYVELSGRDGGPPSPLLQAVIDFDRDGRLSVAGLPTCPPELVANASTEEARRICAGAIVGTGEVDATISLQSGPVPASSPLTIFNGPSMEGHPTAVVHARTTVPGTQTYAILVPIERRPGAFRYRATLNVPPIAAGFGAITRIKVEIGRRYRAGGKRRSYVSARCSDGVLQTHGGFSFKDGTVVEGAVEKFCRAK